MTHPGASDGPGERRSDRKDRKTDDQRDRRPERPTTRETDDQRDRRPDGATERPDDLLEKPFLGEKSTEIIFTYLYYFTCHLG